MATLTATNLTLADWAKRIQPDGRVAVVAELLSQSNEILQDIVYRMGNQPTGHTETVRTGLPTVYWRSLNAGIPSSKSTTAQVTEACGILEARSNVDINLIALNGEEGAFRLSESQAFLEAMSQEMATKLFYGNPATSDPKEPLGLTGRYDDYGAGNAQNILDCGGSGSDNTSIWLIYWGDRTVFGIFPKGSQAGLKHEDLGRQTVQQHGTTHDAVGEPSLFLECKVDWYQWLTGLCVKDWRYAVRMASIDVSELGSQTGDQQTTDIDTGIVHQMARAIARIPAFGMGKACFYMNRTVFSGLMSLALEKSIAVLNVQEGLSQFGTPQQWMSFMGIPIRRCDALVNDEAVPTAA